ncbi:MAG TPA: V-type ATP synthase subunit D [Rhodospirillaceae bacterium]|nr:MAG: hypothetical protein A2018_06630 [Alphaproteobacteria bacterium GWF2_58_20]HAU29859.1 V-type ATP synthase subunit D [Rhodospirillaceae bacterium]
MAEVALNKTSLNRERSTQRTLEKFLPSLQLKRQQLMAEEARAKEAWQKAREELEVQRRESLSMLPMMGSANMDVEGLLKVSNVVMDEENLVGVRVPRLVGVSFDETPYALLTRPHWVDRLVADLKRISEGMIRLAVLEERVKRLAVAVTKLSQRVNLFEKVLIPRTKSNIHRIRIFLSDTERAAVVRSKIAKRKRAVASGEVFEEDGEITFEVIEEGEENT